MFKTYKTTVLLLNFLLTGSSYNYLNLNILYDNFEFFQYNFVILKCDTFNLLIIV